MDYGILRLGPTLTTDNLLRFRNDEFDEMPCKLDSTEDLRSFEKHPIPPCNKVH